MHPIPFIRVSGDHVEAGRQIAAADRPRHPGAAHGRRGDPRRHQPGASSYNNLIAHADGTIVSVEGSGGDYALLSAQDGWLVHTNHYVAPAMLRYEADPNEIAGSVARYRRAAELMASAERPVTAELLRSFLADRAGAPDCLCKIDGRVQTVFWRIIALSQGSIGYGRDPRDPASQHYAFQ